MKVFSLFLSLFFFTLTLEVYAEGSRTWTDTKGKTVSGTPVKKTASSITITLENGKDFSIPLSRLSAGDRDFVKSWSPEEEQTSENDSPPAEKNKPSGKKSDNKKGTYTPNFNAPWPQFIKTPPMPEVSLVKEEGGTYTYETEHFVFEVDAKLSLKLMRTVAAMFEATFEANCELPFNFPCLKVKANPQEKYNAIFYKNTADFQRAVQKGGDTAGVYTPDGTVHVPFSSMGVTAKGEEYTIGRGGDAHTVIHELTHQMSLPSQKRLSASYPIWFSEGVAEYVGYTPYKSGNLNFKQTKQFMVEGVTEFGRKNGGGRNIGKDFKIPSLEKFINQSHETFMRGDGQLNYGFSALLFYYFCHIDGKGDGARIKKYAQAFQENKTPLEANDALLDGRTWEELAKDVETGMKKGLRLKPSIGY